MVLVTDVIKENIQDPCKSRRVWQEIIARINKVLRKQQALWFGWHWRCKEKVLWNDNNLPWPCKINYKTINNLTNWERTLIIARNMYDEDIANEKAVETIDFIEEW